MTDQERLDRIDELELARGNLVAGLEEDHDHELQEDELEDELDDE